MGKRLFILFSGEGADKRISYISPYQFVIDYYPNSKKIRYSEDSFRIEPLLEQIVSRKRRDYLFKEECLKEVTVGDYDYDQIIKMAKGSDKFLVRHLLGLILKAGLELKFV